MDRIYIEWSHDQKFEIERRDRSDVGRWKDYVRRPVSF